MNKIETIARRILGWKLNRWNRWYDFEKGVFFEGFEPENNLDHAMIIIKRLEDLGFTYKTNGTSEVCFNDFCAIGDTLPQAITNAAYLIADNRAIDEGWL